MMLGIFLNLCFVVVIKETDFFLILLRGNCIQLKKIQYTNINENKPVEHETMPLTKTESTIKNLMKFKEKDVQ